MALALRNTIPGPASFPRQCPACEGNRRMSLSPKIQSLSVDDSLPRIYIRTLLVLTPVIKKKQLLCYVQVGQLGGVILFLVRRTKPMYEYIYLVHCILFGLLLALHTHDTNHILSEPWPKNQYVLRKHSFSQSRRWIWPSGGRKMHSILSEKVCRAERLMYR